MVRRVQFLEPASRHVGIDLCRRDVAMSEEELHDAKIRAVIQEVSRERMPQGVRRNRPVNSSLPCIPLNHFPESLPRDALAALFYEQKFRPPAC